MSESINAEPSKDVLIQTIEADVAKIAARAMWREVRKTAAILIGLIAAAVVVYLTADMVYECGAVAERAKQKPKHGVYDIVKITSGEHAGKSGEVVSVSTGQATYAIDLDFGEFANGVPESQIESQSKHLRRQSWRSPSPTLGND